MSRTWEKKKKKKESQEGWQNDRQVLSLWSQGTLEKGLSRLFGSREGRQM